MKRHLLVLLLGLVITHGSVWAWSYFIEGANAKWYAFPVTMLAINVFLVGCAIALAGGEAVKDALKSSGKDSALAELNDRIENVARLNSELDVVRAELNKIEDRAAENNGQTNQPKLPTVPCPNCNPSGVFLYGDERCSICHGKAFLSDNKEPK